MKSGSIYGTVAGQTDFIHFHAAALIIMLVSVGRYLETRARGQALSVVAALARRTPRTARVRRDDGFIEVPVESVALDDVVQILPHSSIPTDGEIIEGRVTLD